MNDGVAAGHYAKKQLFSRSRLIAWSHRARFRLRASSSRRTRASV